MKPDRIIAAANRMSSGEGGSFAASIADAYAVADSANANTLYNAFSELFEKFAPVPHEPVEKCLAYDQELMRLELPPNGDDYNNLMDMVRGFPFRLPVEEDR